MVKEETTENQNKVKVVNRDTELFKIQVYSDRIHTILTIRASLAFVIFSLFSIFYGLYYEGFFNFKISEMVTGYLGIVVIAAFVFLTLWLMVRSYNRNSTKISDMIESVNEGKPLPPLAELHRWKKQ